MPVGAPEFLGGGCWVSGLLLPISQYFQIICPVTEHNPQFDIEAAARRQLLAVGKPNTYKNSYCDILWAFILVWEKKAEAYRSGPTAGHFE